MSENKQSGVTAGTPTPERIGSAEICGETLFNHFTPGTPHICKREKGHDGNHCCGFQDLFDTAPCGHEWPNNQISHAPNLMNNRTNSVRVGLYRLVRRIRLIYWTWKYRHIDPDLCCCGGMISDARPGDSICAHGGCLTCAMDKPNTIREAL